jgi:hypothetical protein
LDELEKMASRLGVVSQFEKIRPTPGRTPAASYGMLSAKQELRAMKHRSIDFDIEEVAPHKWRWKIYPEIEDAPKIVGGELFDSRTSAIEACFTEIDTGLGKT